MYFVKYNYQIAIKILDFTQVFQVVKREEHKKDWMLHETDDSFRICTKADSQMRADIGNVLTLEDGIFKDSRSSGP